MMNKKIIAILFAIYLFLRIISLSSSVFAVDYVVTEQYTIDYYESLINNWLVSFHNLASDTDKAGFIDKVKSGKYQLYFCTRKGSVSYGLADIPTHVPDFTYIYCILIPASSYTSSRYNVMGYHSYENAVNYKFTSDGTSWIYYAVNLSNGSFYQGSATNMSVYSPLVLFDYRSNNFTTYVNNFGTATAQDVVQAIQELGDDILDTSVDDSDISINADSSSVSDTTSFAFDQSFQMLKNSFTSENCPEIEINIPFTNKKFTFNGDILKNSLNDNGGGWVVVIMSSFWFFVVSLYIVKDVYKIINKLKNGDISSTDTNIKADML